MKILIVDDHVLFREGVTSLLSKEPGIDVVGTAKSVKTAIDQTRALNPEIILMDFSMPDGTGLDATRILLAERPDLKIIFLTMHDDDERLFAAIQTGAKGYLLKNTPSKQLVSLLWSAHEGRSVLDPEVTEHILNRFIQMGPGSSAQRRQIEYELTRRELEIFQELVHQKSTNKEIGQRLFISEQTVKNHVSNILAKLQLKNRYEAARLARQLGYTQPEQQNGYK